MFVWFVGLFTMIWVFFIARIIARKKEERKQAQMENSLTSELIKEDDY